MVTIYQQVEQKRKVWTPVKPTKAEFPTEGAEDTISRCLALRSLEMPVKAFIEEGLNRKETHIIGEEGLKSLQRNIQDEEKHDIALNNCTAVTATYDNSVEKEAQELTKAWVEHPDFPITKAAVLENSVFFVVLPIYRLFGGVSLRAASLDISADEINHVQLHRHIAKQVGFKPSKSLDELRKATVQWFMQKFNVTGYKKESFIKSSDDLLYKGITKELNFTQSYQVHAFFEKTNDSLPAYA